MCAARAAEITGATISATTAGRIPLKTLMSVGLLLISSGVRNIAMVRIIRKEGSMVPNAATMLPRRMATRSPTATAMFTARMPGSDCATASRSRKSSRLIHRWVVTISRSIIEIIAQPPPKVKAPILKNVTNICQSRCSDAGVCVSVELSIRYAVYSVCARKGTQKVADSITVIVQSVSTSVGVYCVY